MRIRRRGRIDDHLHQASAIAEVDEDQPAMVADSVHPALQDDVLANVIGADLAAHHATFHQRSQQSAISNQLARSLARGPSYTLLTADC